MIKSQSATDVYHPDETRNAFDNLIVDVQDLYTRFPLSWPDQEKSGRVKFSQTPFHKVYRSPFLPVKHRNVLWHLFRRLHLDLSWFMEFKSYWESVLGGRPLWGVHDFYFLRNLYRLKFQKIFVPDSADEKAHLEAWQEPSVLYQTFQQALKESLANKLPVVKLFRKFTKNKWSTILEYGCAAAPVTTTLFEFFPPAKGRKVFISDIQTISFHYASYKFRNCPQVIPLLLSPDNRFQLSMETKPEAIFCLEVFEHLNEPLTTVQRFQEMLPSGGLLIFDYIKGDAGGLDTLAGNRQRQDVLNYISGHFDVLSGTIEKDKNVGLTVARKR